MNLDPATADLLFTVIASCSLLGLWGLSALVLPCAKRSSTKSKLISTV